MAELDINICKLDNFIVKSCSMKFLEKHKDCFHRVYIGENMTTLTGASICYIMKTLGYDDELCYEEHFKQYEPYIYNEHWIIYKGLNNLIDRINKLNEPVYPLK
jgi:hypothetical protein